MTGAPVQALNAGLAAFREELHQDALARRRVEVAVVTFGGEVKLAQEIVTVDNFTPPTLQAVGLTPMGTAIQKALDLIEARKGQYKANGVAYYRPWVFLITDGAPEGEPEDVIRLPLVCPGAAAAARPVPFAPGSRCRTGLRAPAGPGPARRGPRPAEAGPSAVHPVHHGHADPGGAARDPATAAGRLGGVGLVRQAFAVDHGRTGPDRPADLAGLLRPAAPAGRFPPDAHHAAAAAAAKASQPLAASASDYLQRVTAGTGCFGRARVYFFTRV
jgi:hypothetical protein